MCRLGNNRARPSKRRGVLSIAAALLGAAVLCQPNLAHAAHGGGGGGGHGGGGGFHGGGGGFHGGGFGGFHGGGFHADGFHGGGFHGGFAGGHWNHGWHNGRFGWWWGDGVGLGYYPYDYGWSGYPDYGYYDYGQYNYGQPYASQTWYYCSDPAGYYPYVAQCNTGWQAVPAS